ncbi:hypothetical protein SNEBB_003941 [Seison nebaliae]|nr:hypothetical protein SNEBB_003941 [Seison nebaliae]
MSSNLLSIGIDASTRFAVQRFQQLQYHIKCNLANGYNIESINRLEMVEEMIENIIDNSSNIHPIYCYLMKLQHSQISYIRYGYQEIFVSNYLWKKYLKYFHSHPLHVNLRRTSMKVVNGKKIRLKRLKPERNKPFFFNKHNYTKRLHHLSQVLRNDIDVSRDLYVKVERYFDEILTRTRKRLEELNENIVNLIRIASNSHFSLLMKTNGDDSPSSHPNKFSRRLSKQENDLQKERLCKNDEWMFRDDGVCYSRQRKLFHVLPPVNSNILSQYPLNELLMLMFRRENSSRGFMLRRQIKNMLNVCHQLSHRLKRKHELFERKSFSLKCSVRRMSKFSWNFQERFNYFFSFRTTFDFFHFVHWKLNQMNFHYLQHSFNEILISDYLDEILRESTSLILNDKMEQFEEEEEEESVNRIGNDEIGELNENPIRTIYRQLSVSKQFLSLGKKKRMD